MGRKGAFVGVGDVSVSAAPHDPLRVGRRFNFDVSEEALSQMGAEVLAHAVENLGRNIVSQYRHQAEQEFFRVLTDKANREWVEPLLKEALTKMFFTIVADIMAQNDRDERERGAASHEQHEV